MIAHADVPDAGPIVEALGLGRDYPSGATVVRAVHDVNLSVGLGERARHRPHELSEIGRAHV